MDRLSNFSRPPYGAPMPTRTQRASRGASLKDTDLHDDLASISGSEDGNYPLYHDSSKHDVDHEQGADPALTSQTLNADGTPKRPMNAFMIFARRRRPQVSAENQAMRTGEISKLLSKEWSSMPQSEKHYYQEQAKLLKESFNSKYPEYVYRRRPNNSRRRRRSDASLKSADGAAGGEDGNPAGEFESPTDGEEYETKSDGSYPRNSHEPPSYESMKYPTGPSISRSSTHPFPSNNPLYRDSQDVRLPYPTPADQRLSHRLSQPSLNYSLTSSSSSSFSTDLASQSWHPRMDRGASGPWSTSGSHSDRAGPPSLKTGNYLSGSSNGGWGGLSSSPGNSGSSNFGFPTLNAPFYPSQSSISDYQTESGGGSHYGDPSLSLQPLDRPFDSARGTSIGEPLTYPARGISRGLPPVASISAYPTNLPSTSGHGPIDSANFWQRS